MEGYSSLFMSGFKSQAIPRTPPQVQIGDKTVASNTPRIKTSASPSRSKVFRKRKSSISQEFNPIAGLKSPTRNARSSFLSPVTEKRFFDFNPTSFGTAINFLRRPRVKPPQKPIPTIPLPAIPIDASSPPSTPKKAHSILPPSSPTMPEAAFDPFKNNVALRKRSVDRLPKLRLKTSGIFNCRGPLSASFNMNSRNSSRAPSPGLLSPDFAYSINTASSANISTTTLQTPLSAPFSFIDCGMTGVKEVNEEEGVDVDMN